MIHKIGHGNLNKKAIESFFTSLVNDPEVLNSRYFLFFLRADEEAFHKKSSDDFDWVKNMANQFSQNNEYQIKELGLDLKENQPDLSQEDKKKLNIFCDTTERIEKKNHQTVNRVTKLIKTIVKNFTSLSESIFELGQEFKGLAEGYKTLESLAETNLKLDSIKQGDLYETLMSTFFDYSKAIKRSGSNFERHFPPFFKIHEQNFQHLDHVSSLI